MFGDTIRSCQNRVRLVAVASASRARCFADIGTDDADGVINGERQGDGAPFAGLVQNKLSAGGAAAGQRRKQLEPPVVLIRREHLPAVFVVVPNAPDPISAAELDGRKPGRLMQGDHGRTLGGRITNGMPDRFGWFAGVHRIVQAGLEVKDGPTAGHLHPAVWLGGCRRLPSSRQLKDGKTRTITQAHDRPLHAQPRLLPQNPRQAKW